MFILNTESDDFRDIVSDQGNDHGHTGVSDDMVLAIFNHIIHDLEVAKDPEIKIKVIMYIEMILEIRKDFKYKSNLYETLARISKRLRQQNQSATQLIVTEKAALG